MASRTDSTIAWSGVLLALLVSPSLSRSQEAMPSTKEAAKATPAVSEKERPPFDLTYVPPDATAVIAIRPNVIFHDPAMQSLAQLAKQFPLMQMLLPYVPSADVKLSIQEIEQVVLVIAPPSDKRSKGDDRSMLVTTVMIRTARDFDWLKLMQHIDPKTKEVRHGDHVYYRSHPKWEKGGLFSEIPIAPKTTFCYLIPDKRTLVLVPNSLLRAVENGEEIQRPHFSWDKDWKHVERDLYAMAQSDRQGRGASKKQSDEQADCNTLTENAIAMVGGVDWKDGIDIHAYLACEEANAAERTIELVKEFLSQLRRDLVKDAAEAPEAERRSASLVRLWKSLIDHVRITRHESTVCIHTRAKMTIAEAAKSLMSQFLEVSPAEKLK